MAGIKPQQRPVHELAVGEGAGRIGCRRRIDRIELDLDRPSSPTPGKVEARVDGQPVEPGLEPVGITETRQVAPGADEGLLDRVARELRVPEDEASGRVQPREGRIDERREGVMIASLRPTDELSLVHDRLCLRWCDRVVASSGYGVSVTPKVHQAVGARAWRRIVAMSDEHEHHHHHEHEHEHEHEHAHAHEHEHEHEPIDYVAAVEGFRADKDHYFRHGDGSPLPEGERDTFEGLPYFPVDPELRFEGLELAPYAGSEPQRFQIPTSDGQLRPAHRAGSLHFELGGEGRSLAAYVMDAHTAPGHEGHEILPSVFVPFLDATSGHETYGAGRYLDLEPEEDGTYSLDFNLAYHPSCVYDIRFSCPLTPAENRLPVRIEAGERLPEGYAETH